MTAPNIDFLTGTAYLSALWVCWFWGVQPLLTEWLRQELFDVRGDLFLLAANGRIRFDAPQYCELRWRINALIRQSQKISLPRSICVYLAFRASTVPPVDGWASSLESLDTGTAKQLRDLHKRVMKAIAFRLLLLPALSLLPLALPICLWLRGWRAIVASKVTVVEKGVIDLDSAERARA